MNKKTLTLVIILCVLLLAGATALGIWLLVSGIQGAQDDGATNWEVFKIVLGGIMCSSIAFGSNGRSK